MQEEALSLRQTQVAKLERALSHTQAQVLTLEQAPTPNQAGDLEIMADDMLEETRNSKQVGRLEQARSDVQKEEGSDEVKRQIVLATEALAALQGIEQQVEVAKQRCFDMQLLMHLPDYDEVFNFKAEVSGCAFQHTYIIK
jgi:hypothetical protein